MLLVLMLMVVCVSFRLLIIVRCMVIRCVSLSGVISLLVRCWLICWSLKLILLILVV